MDSMNWKRKHLDQSPSELPPKRMLLLTLDELMDHVADEDLRGKLKDEIDSIYLQNLSLKETIRAKEELIESQRTTIDALRTVIQIMKQPEAREQQHKRFPVISNFLEPYGYLTPLKNCEADRSSVSRLLLDEANAPIDLEHFYRMSESSSSSSPPPPPSGSSRLMKLQLNYDVNFGSFGTEDGQFSEPAGICVTREGFIAITDTKNHRVQVFDKIGCLKLAFGVSGTNPGQILYPNCIASCPVTGNYVITERTPVHQVQVYSVTGQYVRRFGQSLLQFPRGVCVDKNGNVIVVECKVMRITIFTQSGITIRTFCAPSVLSFPMDICCNETQEIFVVDNRRHSVQVFDYNGNALRTICDNGSISFPISISINPVGELVVTDNHQSFNMTFFNKKGEFLRAYESRNRHPQCLAATVYGNDKIFLATKDFRVYGYSCSGRN